MYLVWQECLARILELVTGTRLPYSSKVGKKSTDGAGNVKLSVQKKRKKGHRGAEIKNYASINNTLSG